MTRRRIKPRALAILAAVLLSVAAPPLAAPVPSKPAPRDANAATVRSFLGRDDVARALARAGLTPPQIEQRLTRLSDEDLRSLASNLDQVQAAGTEVPRYIWVLLAVLLGVLILTAIF